MLETPGLQSSVGVWRTCSREMLGRPAVAVALVPALLGPTLQ